MIHDQKRIAFFNDVHGAATEMMVISTAQGIPLDWPKANNNWYYAGMSAVVVDRNLDLQLELGRAKRTFAQPGMADTDLIDQLRGMVKDLEPISFEAQRLRKAGDVNAAAQIGRTTLNDGYRAIQRVAYTRVQEIETEMNARARATASAFLSSRQNILAAALAAIGAALLLGYSLSASLTWPITHIRSALSQIAGGGFDARVSVPNRDELGALAGHVNDTSARLGALYSEVETQKEELAGWNSALESKVADQLDEIERTNRLRRFLPPQVAKLITESDNETDALRTKRGEVTVLFADLRGFTTFSNAAPPDQVIGALNAFHAACGPLVEAHGGTLERFLGDGLMVLFGAPLPMEDAAEQAVALAKEMRPAVQAALADFEVNGRRLGFGIGIATGPATLGQIGFEDRLDYSAIGPAPNLAARLCDEATDGQILLSHSTVWQITAETRAAGSVDLKGVGDDISVFEAV